MTLYARSDVMSVSIPTTNGGCNSTHSRPVVKGVPAKVWGLTCAPCEAHLKGDGKPKKLVYQIDKNTGQALRQERVSDSDSMWGSTPDTVPLTPDEERTNATRTERGRMQIEMIQALAAIRATGLQVPAEAMFLLEREIPEGVLKGTVLCANSHDVPAGSKFCPDCGVGMNVKAATAAIAPPAGDEPAVVDLGRLHVATLKKMCRDAKLPDKGSKDELVGRLQAA